MDHSYSERNPVPTISAFEAERERVLQQASPTSSTHSNTDKELPSPPGKKSSGSDKSSLDENLPGREEDTHIDEKARMKDQMTTAYEAPTEKLKKRKGGARTVKDPVTGLDVVIKDAKFKDYPVNSELDPQTAGGPATQLPSTPKKKRTFNASSPSSPVSPSHTSPNPSKAGNVSLFPYLPPNPPELTTLERTLDQLQIALAAAFAIMWFFFAFPTTGRWYIPFTKPFWTLVWRSTFIASVGGVLVSVVSVVQRKISKEFPRLASSMHQIRGETYSPPTPESVEWLNAFISTFWGLVNPDMFVPIADMVEDVMQQSLPSFVDAVRMSDIGQGSNPVRIVSMRALPDRPEDKDYPKEEWIDQGTGKLEAKAKEDREQSGVKEVDTDQSGDYVNFEVALSYQALPGQGHDLRSKNIHLLIEFFLGVYDWLHIPIPIWIQVEGFVATARVRLQFIQQFPYVRNVTFTLMGVPAVEVSAIPMTTGIGPIKMPNVLDLPLISRFVRSAIQAGTAAYVAPQSMTLNMMEMLSGNAIDDTRAEGVFIITIHHAEGLSAQDKNGSSDPYIVLAFAKFGKPLYSTRIILGDLNPCFEETTALLVGKDDVKSGEDLAVMLWDSDRRTADDLIGRVQIPIKELMKQPNEMKTRTDPLTGFEDADKMSGTLHWSIGYYEKVPLRKDLELPPVDQPPPPKKTTTEMEMRPGDKAPNPGARDLPPPPPDVQRTPPDPDYPSGILSIVIHQINNLERQNLKGTTGKDREGQAGQDTDNPSEESSNLPSSYCEIIVNDDLIYKTRVKQYTSMPYFEAGTERFIRDWQNTVVRLVVRDSRLREKDPILGVVNLKLRDLFAEGSEVSRLMPITEGIGFGRLNASLLFRGVKVEQPHAGLGWDTGTVEILAPITLHLNDSSTLNAQAMDMTLSTTDSTERISASASSTNGNGISWKITQDDSSDAPLRLPVYNRYASSLTFELGKGSKLPIGNNGKMQAVAALWLKDVADDEEVDVDIPVVIAKNLKQLRQNVLTDFTAKTHDYQVVGSIKTKIRLDKGLDEDHQSHARSQARRHAFEAYDHVEGEAIIAERNAHADDDGVIDSKEKKAIQKAHQRQLANRQRGIYGFRPYRTGLWMKEGLKSRIVRKKTTVKREPAVQSEGQM